MTPQLVIETTPFDAYLALAEKLGATVRLIEGSKDHFAVHHPDNVTCERLWMLAKAVGDVSRAICGWNRFLLVRPWEGGF